MARYLYCRVSTRHQSFEQQMQDIKAYGIDPNTVDGIVEEKESGGTEYSDRKFQQLLNKCKKGDYIYAASTDRLGRNFVDMIRLMEDAKKRGVIIIACKQGLSLADDNMATKIILAVTAIIDEDERMRIKHRVQNGVDVAREQLRKNGHRITKRGTIQTHWGNKKGCDMMAANEASVRSKQNRKIVWMQQSKAVRFATRKKAEGWGVIQITDELGKLYDDAPEVYGTPTGCKPTKGTISKWLRESNPLVL